MNVGETIHDYQSGMSIESVAKKHGIGKLKLKSILAENGVEIKKRGGQKNDWDSIGDTRKIKKKSLKWDYEACKEEAAKYKTRSEFQKGNQAAYKASNRYGWLDDFFAVKTVNTKEEKHVHKFCTEDFKKMVIEKHGDKFDLTDSVYINRKTPVYAICCKHGGFTALPEAFYNGIACPECIRESNRERRLSNIDEFKQKYIERYGDKLIFDKSLYNGNDIRMTVTCPIHGDFEMTPNKLLNGFGCHECAKERVSAKMTLTQEEFLKRVHETFGELYDTSMAVYSGAKEKVKMVCKEHGVFEQTPEMLFNGYGCPHCSNQSSMEEREITDYVTSLVGCENVVVKDRTVLEGKEIDILVPSKKIGIEYNGNWWHCESNGKGRKYHVDKTNLAESKGYRLIQIFEDEYKEKKDIVLEKIKHILGCNNDSIKIGARKCMITEVDKDIAREFLNKFHIQGFASATVYYGAYYGSTLLGVMTFTKEKDEQWNLNRYATDTTYSVPGLASKMFKYFTVNNKVKSVKSFLDRRWGKAGNSVYEKMGFKVDSVEAPDYRYLCDGKRVHKFNFRKQTVNKKYGLPVTMTETEMMQELCIPRIWDCGLIKYVWSDTGK